LFFRQRLPFLQPTRLLELTDLDFSNDTLELDFTSPLHIDTFDDLTYLISRPTFPFSGSASHFIINWIVTLMLLAVLLPQLICIPDYLQFLEDCKPLHRLWKTSDNVQSLRDAFGWPAQVKEKLPDVVASIEKNGHIPVISTGLCLRVASFFSGICSQSRGAQILQNHGFGVSFSHIAFTEKSKQCHSVLKEDFPDSCLFKDQMHYLTPKCREQVASAKNCEAVVACLKEASFGRRAACLRHDDCCRLPRTSLDLAVFGAPCVDDSAAGKSLKEEGPARRAIWFAFGLLMSLV